MLTSAGTTDAAIGTPGEMWIEPNENRGSTCKSALSLAWVVPYKQPINNYYEVWVDAISASIVGGVGSVCKTPSPDPVIKAAVKTLPMQGIAECVAFSSDGQDLATGGKRLNVFNAATGALRATLTDPSNVIVVEVRELFEKWTLPGGLVR